ncbi:antibiotic biosynthesis monooxygenase family protein [Komagataeibacter oboediens]|uniref:Antibiotic biosynthesis monooxygenase n=1 Tax=Komagataeibacter oboediens TaxID=65958 RepID=A0ABS5SLJ4_9PROT|nr:antibiotic biosynthesis monooxygenase [Komagataeibacter oboediens]MBL7232952.1 antibiotic biosynthesis monooxygenase [Komagataeibacter oboediens]MBT0675073.1 antibiotic biosynthesis monooxygenase [Komagataeibacter oboediens]MBT0678389.1 antibiotic biosynthesis monooxygenase [Komagataeibacter oboediens]
MYIAMNRFRVRPECTGEFEQRWLERDVLLKTVPGFVSFQFLRGPAREDHVLFASHTVWASHAAFGAWTQSEQFRQAHAQTGQGKVLTIGPPIFEGFDVLQDITGQD